MTGEIYTGISGVWSLADASAVLAKVEAALKASVDNGDIPEMLDLSGCSAAYIDDSSGFSCAVFSVEGKRAYMWFWYRELAGNGDGLMEKLVEHAIWMGSTKGAQRVECGISPDNEKSRKLAERLGFSGTRVYYERAI